jgi:hypothetical protein
MGIVWLVKGESAGLGWHFVLYTFADRVPPGLEFRTGRVAGPR